MKEISLTQNQVALVDDDVFEYLNQFKWQASNRGNKFYACRDKTKKDSADSSKKIYMHRAILEFYGLDLKGRQVDHVNGNPLDNRRENLRACTASENQHNAKPRKNNTSGFKGVDWFKPTKKWRAKIMFESSLIHLGFFESPEAAGFAYNVAASMLHKDFAYYNPIVVVAKLHKSPSDLPTQSQIQTAVHQHINT